MSDSNAQNDTRAGHRAKFGSGAGSGSNPAAPAGTLPAGTPERIGRFEIRALLGEGAFGRVYRGYDSELRRDVAIKVPHTQGLNDEFRERFLREARAIAAIHHPNVCPVFEVGTDGDLPFIVMRFVAGTTLASIVDNLKAPMPPRNAAMIARKLALGMAAAHAQGVTHRDLKPANVLYETANREVLITDFGLARMGGEINLTAKDSFLGTPAYTSPEQANRQMHEVGPLSDVYSLGVILYEMLTGDVPFNGSVMEVAIAHCITPPTPPSEKRAGIDPELDAIVLRVMAKKPDDRYPSAKAFADALTDYLRPAGGSTGSVELPPVSGSAATRGGAETVAEKRSGGRRTAPAVEVPAKPQVVVEVDEDDEDESTKETKRSVGNRKTLKQSKAGGKKKKKKDQNPLARYAVPAVGGVLGVVALVLLIVFLARDKKDVAKSPPPAENTPAPTPTPQPQPQPQPKVQPAKVDPAAAADARIKNMILGRWRVNSNITDLLTGAQILELQGMKGFAYLEFKSDGAVLVGFDTLDSDPTVRIKLAKDYPPIPMKYRTVAPDKVEFSSVPRLFQKYPPLIGGAQPVVQLNGDILTLRTGNTTTRLIRVVVN